MTRKSAEGGTGSASARLSAGLERTRLANVGRPWASGWARYIGVRSVVTGGALTADAVLRAAFFAGTFFAAIAPFFATAFLTAGFLTAAFFAGAFLAVVAPFFAVTFLATPFLAVAFLSATFFAAAF